ncbi:acyl-CoA dehydrogenase family protein [Halogeometricum sp. S1BR25-6]|uniref:Acyl-CoA dehydrogenase family protein n=1 Tax=Halogeometricum salsisoli TaxID=2950536 RepID=A0ABU2GJR6_9EURY|nr:acyl-CoA dehydrogenase family protein [Halogeometricum sp. S1BR25-6]MDS0300529.1 acyl-CoA dehydrogenase family protein [Halogeometricum sp. S1BR25-6]
MHLIESALSESHRTVRDRADAFAEEVVAPRAEEIEETDEFPRDVVEAAGERGLLGLLLPDGYGDLSSDFLGYCLAVERIAAESGAVAETIQGHTFAALPVARFGTDEQKERYLEPMARGEAVGAMLLTEPGAGSSPSELETVAEATDDGYRLSGEKAFGTNAGVADVHLVVARKRPQPDDSHGVSVFLVPGADETAGFAFDRVEYMGMRGHVTGDSTFDGVVVPADDLLGSVGQGFRIAMGTIDMARTGIGAIGTGIARGAFDAAVDYAGDREQGGKAIGEYQAVQVLVADMYQQLSAARHSVYSSALAISEDDGETRLSSAAKLAGSEAAEFVTRNAMQVYGGKGYRTDLPLERYYRDARILSLIGGTSEIQRTTIARETLDL